MDGVTGSQAWRKEPGTWVAIAVALLLWAAAFAGIRAGLESYGPGEIALFRFGTASVALAVYAVFTKMRLPDKRDLPQIALAGFLGILLALPAAAGRQCSGMSFSISASWVVLATLSMRPPTDVTAVSLRNSRNVS